MNWRKYLKYKRECDKYLKYTDESYYFNTAIDMIISTDVGQPMAINGRIVTAGTPVQRGSIWDTI